MGMSPLFEVFPDITQISCLYAEYRQTYNPYRFDWRPRENRAENQPMRNHGV